VLEGDAFSAPAPATGATLVSALRNERHAADLQPGYRTAAVDRTGEGVYMDLDPVDKSDPANPVLYSRKPQDQRKATASINNAAVNNSDITFTAKSAGQLLNGYRVEIVHDGTINANAAVVEWLPAQKLLRFRVDTRAHDRGHGADALANHAVAGGPV